MLNYLPAFVLHANFWLVCCWPLAFKRAQMLRVVICGASDTANSSSSSELIQAHTLPKGAEESSDLWKLVLRWIPWYLSTSELHPLL